MEEKDRLTSKIKIGVFASLKAKAVSKVGAFNDYDAFYAVGIATNKLYEYEQTGLSPNEIEALKAENGELKARLSKAVELPLKIGDTVWIVYTKNQREPFEFKVADVQITLQHFKIYVMGTEDGGWLNYTVFLNKEQAEARLKELKGVSRNEAR